MLVTGQAPLPGSNSCA